MPLVWALLAALLWVRSLRWIGSELAGATEEEQEASGAKSTFVGLMRHAAESAGKGALGVHGRPCCSSGCACRWYRVNKGSLRMQTSKKEGETW